MYSYVAYPPATSRNECCMKLATPHRNACTAICLLLLLLALVLVTPAGAQVPVVHKNPYVVRTFVDERGQEIAEIVVPERPPAIKAAVASVPEPNIAMGINSLPDVPAFDWCYGCSATSAAMMFGYYDRTGYSNMYAGPTNGGVCPLTNSVWGYEECPLSATRQGYDGLLEKGHVNDYWYSYGSTNDPYYGHWPEHGYADCTADFMGTNQYQNWQNKDGATTFYYYTSGAPLYDYSGCEPSQRDGTHGMRLFVESRGYNVLFYDGHYQNYFQLIYGYNGNTQGFTFDQYKAEIDAGRPVFIQVEGHSMLGFGYSDPNTVYLHDTWDHSDHMMTWGGTYSGLQHYGVTVIKLKALPEINSCDSGGGAQTFFQPGGSVYVQGSNFDSSTNYKIWIQDSPVSEGDPLIPGEDASGSQESVTTDGSDMLSPTLAWPISGDPCTHHDYDIIVDKQGDGGTGYYNAASDGKTTFHLGMGGDVNGGGEVDLGDVILLHYHYVYPETYALSNEWAGDCNCDGKIDLGDVILLHYHYVYPETYTLNCCPT